MWNKIFVGAIAFFSVLVGFFTFYSWSWLQSIGSPQAAVEGYAYNADLGWTTFWIGTIVLLILANIVLLKTEKAWALWSTFGFFVVFVVAKYFWVGITAIEFERQSSLPISGSVLGPFLAVILCLIFGAFIYADQLLAVRLMRRIYPSADPDELDQESPVFEDPKISVDK